MSEIRDLENINPNLPEYNDEWDYRESYLETVDRAVNGVW